MGTSDFSKSPIATDLQDIYFAAEYLEDALHEGVQDFVIALRNVADANGGLGHLSKLSQLGRESLYKTLSQERNSKPYFATIQQILNSLGMRIAIVPDVDKEAA